MPATTPPLHRPIHREHPASRAVPQNQDQPLQADPTGVDETDRGTPRVTGLQDDFAPEPWDARYYSRRSTFPQVTRVACSSIT